MTLTDKTGDRADPIGLELTGSLDLSLDRRELAESLAPVVARLESLPGGDLSAEVAESVLAMCRRLYAGARSGDALPLCRALLEHSVRSGDAHLERRASGTCGLLAADSGDVVGAIEFHVRSMGLATAQGDRSGQGGAWNNIGLAFGVAGNHELQARCYQRALALVEGNAGSDYTRYTASCNMARSLYYLGDVREGLRFAQIALGEMTPAFVERDLNSAILVYRNLARLLIAAGRLDEAKGHVARVAELAARARTPRAMVAAALTHAVYELANGRIDIALTRLDGALSKARGIPAALRDTLSFIVRAEEAAGNTERALMRLQELSDHVYRSAIDRARSHFELAGLWEVPATRDESLREQAHAKLVSHLHPPAEPEQWKALQRLAISSALRIDNTGWHGVRVGELTKALAVACGVPPLQALEIGLAAELHDIGLSCVPEAILCKRGELNEVERSLLDRHAEAGAEMLRDDDHPRTLMAREIARYHHARWDGEGNPARVGGLFIPAPARMCAVADAYDAMVCGFGRRKAMTMEESLAELRRESGRQFDPELVIRFEAMIRDETTDRGIDPSTTAGLESFQELVLSLQEDRGYA